MFLHSSLRLSNIEVNNGFKVSTYCKSLNPSVFGELILMTK